MEDFLEIQHSALRAKFLKEFISEIIKEVRRNLPEDEARNILDEVEEKPLPHIEIEEPKKEAPKEIPKKPEIRPLIISTPKMPEPESYEPQLYEDPNQTDLLALGELRRYLMDPNTQVIECPGPNKSIIIRHNGITQPVRHYLTEEQINDVLTEVSQKTLIPIMPGVFKTALGNLIITAVISEYVGTRFVIQKLRPGQPLQMPE